MRIYLFIISILLLSFQAFCLKTQKQVETKSLVALQQEFVDLKFGMFIHFNIPTFMDHDWADPDASPSVFNPAKLDCSQWAKAAKSARMKYGCLTTKHHSGFCIWNTKTTDYNSMNSPVRRDVVKEYVDAFHKEGLRTMLYYSILDTHHKLRPCYITQEHVKMVKDQLTELLTGYGEIDALIIDGWDAPWSRISYEEIPFEEIYYLIKQLQPNCLVMDLNAAKYPAEVLFYTDIKSYEQGAGQHISKEYNRLPALSCLPVNKNWFWKKNFPDTPVKDPDMLVYENLGLFNQAYCNFILNVAPNRDGLIDDNAIIALKRIGELWNDQSSTPSLPSYDAPIVSSNIAKHQQCNSSWSDDMWIMDFGNDDNFKTSWRSNPTIKKPWYEIVFSRYQTFNTIAIYDTNQSFQEYELLYECDGVWKSLYKGNNDNKIKIHRFENILGGKVKIIISSFSSPPSIAEFGVYNERR